MSKSAIGVSALATLPDGCLLVKVDIIDTIVIQMERFVQ
jgi:hypothetical protein